MRYGNIKKSRELFLNIYSIDINLDIKYSKNYLNDIKYLSIKKVCKMEILQELKIFKSIIKNISIKRRM